MYAHVATSTGWRFEDIDRLTLFDIADLNRYWQGQPPVHVMVAAYLGVRKPAQPEKATPEKLEEFAKAFGLKVKQQNDP